MQTTNLSHQQLPSALEKAPWVLQGDDLLPTSRALLLLQDPALQYGWGCFTTIRIEDGHPMLWKAHQQRMAQQSRALGLPAPSISWPRIQDLLHRSHATQGVWRLKLLHLWPGNLCAWCLPCPPQPAHLCVRSVSLEPWMDQPVFKELAYGRRLFLRAQAQKDGHDTVIALDAERRCWASPCHACIGVGDRLLYLPRPTQGSLSAAVLRELAHTMGWNAREEPIPPGVPLLLSNALHGALPVAKIDGRPAPISMDSEQLCRHYELVVREMCLEHV